MGAGSCLAQSSRNESQLNSQSSDKSDYVRIADSDGTADGQPDISNVPETANSEEANKHRRDDEFEKKTKKLVEQAEKYTNDSEAKRGLEYSMLNETITLLKTGKLRQGTQCLRRLCEKYPDNGDYRRLVDLAEGRLKSEMWYRFQRRNLNSRKKESMWIDNDDERLNRLKHSTWLLLSKNTSKKN